MHATLPRLQALGLSSVSREPRRPLLVTSRTQFSASFMREDRSRAMWGSWDPPPLPPPINPCKGRPLRVWVWV